MQNTEYHARLNLKSNCVWIVQTIMYLFPYFKNIAMMFFKNELR